MNVLSFVLPPSRQVPFLTRSFFSFFRRADEAEPPPWFRKVSFVLLSRGVKVFSFQVYPLGGVGLPAKLLEMISPQDGSL